MNSFSRLKRITALMLGAFFALSSVTFAGTPVKRVLVEDATGAWCGYCPRGATTLESIVAKYPDQVIGVAMHNQDKMSLTEETQFSAAYVNGYPNGVIDRAWHQGYSGVGSQNPKSGVSDNAWEAVVKKQLAAGTNADVAIANMNFNSTTRVLTFDVTAEFTSALSGDYRFNAYVVEDAVKGIGTGYDQVNYMDNDANSPWYKKGNPIKGFVHPHVVRKVMGGMFGEQGSLPSSIASGTPYKKSYSVTVPTTWDVTNLSIVGFVINYDSDAKKHNVLNAAEEKVSKLPAVTAGLSIASKYLLAPRNNSVTKEITIANPTSKVLPVTLSVDQDASYLPDGWSASVSPSTIDVPANGTAKVNVIINNPANAAFVHVVVNAQPNPDANEAIGKSSQIDVYALSENAKYVTLTGLADYPTAYMNALGATDYADEMVTLPYSTEVMTAYASQKFDVTILPMNAPSQNSQRGIPLAISGQLDMPAIVNALMAEGRKVLLINNSGLFFTYDINAPAATKIQSSKDFFNKLGIGYAGSKARFSGNTLSQYTVTGVSNDEIGKSFSSPMTGGTTNIYGYNLYTDVISLKSGSTSKPIFFYDNDEEQIAAVRYESGAAKLVYMTFGIEGLGSTGTHTEMMQEIMKYLVGEKQAAGITYSTTNLDFNKVAPNNSKDMTVTVSSNGNIPLTITTMEVIGDNKTNFTIVNMPGLPLTLAPGQSKDITIRFTPDKNASFSADLKLTTNTASEETVFLQGEGDAAASVEFDAASAALLELKVGQNPVADVTTISYTVKGNASQTVQLMLVDERGREVMNFGTELSAPGTVTKELNSAKLASGSYRLVAKSNLASVQIPVVIAH